MATNVSKQEKRVEELELKVASLQRTVAGVSKQMEADRRAQLEGNAKILKRIERLEPGREFERQMSGC